MPDCIFFFLHGAQRGKWKEKKPIWMKEDSTGTFMCEKDYCEPKNCVCSCNRCALGVDIHLPVIHIKTWAATVLQHCPVSLKVNAPAHGC